jgi:hypothetical protein
MSANQTFCLVVSIKARWGEESRTISERQKYVVSGCFRRVDGWSDGRRTGRADLLGGKATGPTQIVRSACRQHGWRPGRCQLERLLQHFAANLREFCSTFAKLRDFCGCKTRTTCHGLLGLPGYASFAAPPPSCGDSHTMDCPVVWLFSAFPQVAAPIVWGFPRPFGGGAHCVGHAMARALQAPHISGGQLGKRRRDPHDGRPPFSPAPHNRTNQADRSQSPTRWHQSTGQTPPAPTR